MTRTRGEKKRKMVAAAPAYLKRLVEREEELSFVEINSQHGEDNEMRADALEYVTEKMPKDVFVELMDLMVPRWDDARRVNGGK